MAFARKTNQGGRSGQTDEMSAARERVEDASESEGAGGAPHFEEGFTGKVMIGTLFVCLFMLPGAIYLGLVAGQSLGAAAQWVTIVLFSEVARRSFMPLKRQEIYCLFYMAGALTVTGFTVLPGVSGGPFGGLIGLQFLMQSPAMHAVAEKLPTWIAPHPGSTAYLHRSLLDKDWYLPLLWSPVPILIATQILDRMKWMGLGYLLFRVTSDIERLPFPMASVAASGATALAEASTKEESWRWRVFSAGTVIGLIFGFFYLAIPIFTGVVFSQPIQLLPIPFFDFTTNVERILPTSLVGYNPDLGSLLIGFVLPYSVVKGSVIGSVLAQIVANPILHHFGMFPNWVSGSPAIQTKISVDFDFWMSFGIGTQMSVALIGIGSIIFMMVKARGQEPAARRGSLAKIPKGRGDFPWYVALGVWFLATLGYVVMNHHLIPGFPIWIVAFFGLIWTPIYSYVSARMLALTGQSIDFPFMNQLVVLGTHYSQPDIWFAPLPLNNYGAQAQKFREIELTGTKFTSILKLEMFMLPLILIFSLVYWGFLWYTNDIPSVQFPYAQKFWPQFAVTQAIWTQINSVGGATWALHAIKPHLIAIGGVSGLALYGLVKLLGQPVSFFYGFIAGMGNYPHNTIPTFVGAWLGKKVFARSFGQERWQLYAPVLLAGFSCGTGLIGMCAIALALISKTVSYLPF